MIAETGDVRMIRYFEEQIKELEHAIHSLDEAMFRKMLESAVGTIKAGKSKKAEKRKQRK